MSKFPCSDCKKECLSELVGTYLLVVIGPASIIVSTLIPGFTPLEALLFIAFSFGAVVALAIFLFGTYSGAVINPAITCGAAVARVLHSKYFAPYLFFQILGGVIAGFTLRLIFSSTAPGSTTELGSTGLAPGISPALGIILEAAGTFVLTISALVASTNVRGRDRQALLVGSTLFFLILLIGPLTGAGFNPARSLGPSLASGYVGSLYVYFIGPLIGALLAGLLFRLIRDHGNRMPSKGNLVCLC